MNRDISMWNYYLLKKVIRKLNILIKMLRKKERTDEDKQKSKLILWNNMLKFWTSIIFSNFVNIVNIKEGNFKFARLI